MSGQRVLSEMITRYGWKKGVELGVANGATLFFLLGKHSDLELDGVDSYEVSPGKGNKHTTGFVQYDKSQQVALSLRVAIRIADDFSDRSHLFVMSTTLAAEEFESDTLDFVFIDPDHRESFVRADIAAWVSKLKKYGYLVGHDWKFPSVHKALDAMIPGWKSQESIWYISKEKVCFS